MEAEARVLAGLPAQGRGRWADADARADDGLRREVFFFRSRGVELYGSLFAAAERTRPYGVVTCQSWGTDADRSDPLLRSVALAMAKLGGAGMVFHYPGFGDSFGNLGALTLADLGEAARDAVAEAARRCPGLSWIFAGFMLGASVAALAQPEADVERLLLVQPALRPGTYFRQLAGRTEPLAPGPSPRAMMTAGTTPGMAYGYPIPHRIAADPAQADLAVAAALAAFEGEGAILRHEEPPEDDPAPARFERLSVPGRWRFGSQNHPRLAAACSDWLERRTRSGR